MRVRKRTPTRLWINNPTPAELAAALEQGAVSCTTNPAFSGSLLKRQPDLVTGLVRESIPVSEDDNVVVAAVQAALVRPILECFDRRYEQSFGTEGLVSVQGDPEADGTSSAILRAAYATRAMGPNAVPKIPGTAPGFEAVAELVAAGHPVIVTEVFSLAQLRYGANLYRRLAPASGRAAYVMAPITGIFGDRLRAVAASSGLDVDPALIERAGSEFARQCSRYVNENDLPVRLLFGGARSTRDFTGLIGRREGITVNFSTIEELVAANPRVTRTIDRHESRSVVASLTSRFEEFRRALDPDAIALDEFEEFGPVQHFRDNFIAGWSSVRQAVAAERSRAPATAG